MASFGLGAQARDVEHGGPEEPVEILNVFADEVVDFEAGDVPEFLGSFGIFAEFGAEAGEVADLPGASNQL